MCVLDTMQMEVTRTYTARQPDELSLQVADVVLVSQVVEDGTFALPAFHAASPPSIVKDQTDATLLTSVSPHQAGAKATDCATGREGGSSPSAPSQSRARPPSSATCSGWTACRGWRRTSERDETAASGLPLGL